MAPEIVRVSDSISSALDKLYRRGGFALAFGFAGIFSMLVSNILSSSLSPWLFAVGAAMTFLCLGFFMYVNVAGVKKVGKTISDSKETIDAVQDISLQLTRFAHTLQSLSFRHIETINKGLQVLCPIAEQIPLVGPKVRALGLSDASAVSQRIVDSTEKCEQIITDVQAALITCDHKKLNKYSSELDSVINTLRDVLRQ